MDNRTGASSPTPQGQIAQLLHSIHGLRDKRCDDWLLMSSIWPTILLSTSYYILVRQAGPWFMKNRSDYKERLIQLSTLSRQGTF